jgi:hypothetical protein
MKTLSAVLIAVLIALTCTAANAASCKYQVDTVSYASGEKIRWTRWKMNRKFHTGSYSLISGIAEGDRKYLGVQLVDTSKKVTSRPTKAELDAMMVIPAGAKLSLLMADESIVDLFTEEDVVADSDFTTEALDSYSIESAAVIKFPLSVEAFAALSAQNVMDVRVHTDQKQFEYSFGKKGSDKIQEALGCIL